MTKRSVSLALAFLTLMALFVPAAMAGGESPNVHSGYYYVQTDNGKGLNVRDNPNGRVVGSLKYGARIYVDAFTTPEWALITYRYDNGSGMDDYSAYVSTRYLVRSDPGEYQGLSSPASSGGSPSASQSISFLNAIFRTAKLVAEPYSVVSRPARASGWVYLRWAPSTDADVIATCPQGKTLTVLAEMRGWYQVKDPVTGMTGFINSQYVAIH